MFTFKTRLFALAICALPLLASGCGKVPGSSSAAGREGTVSYAPHFLTNPTGAVGTLVDGRLYAKGSEPVIAVTPPPAAPDAGMGHLHVSVGLQGVTDFVGKIRIRLRHDGDAEGAPDVSSYDFAKTRLVGSSAQTTLLNVTPGDYIIIKDTLSTTGGIFLEESASAQVIAGKTAECKL